MAEDAGDVLMGTSSSGEVWMGPVRQFVTLGRDVRRTKRFFAAG